MKPSRGSEVGAGRAFVLLSALLLPTPTVCVNAVFVSDALEQAVTPAPDARIHALPTYWVAPTEGPGIPPAAADMSARFLEKEIRSKLADKERVQEAKEIYRRVTNCPSYPCEVLVEEVEIIGNVYRFRLDSKFYERRSDRQPKPDHHGIDPWPCPTSQDLRAEDCLSEAPEKLAHALKVHDETYHPRNQ